jgi:hypothetical protein
MPLFNSFRKGLQLFVIYTRDGHPVGMLWAGSSEAAKGRADRLGGAGSTVERA